MNHKKAKKMRQSFRDKIQSDATKLLRHEIFRLARNRDILGIVVIVETIAIIILGIALLK